MTHATSFLDKAIPSIMDNKHNYSTPSNNKDLTNSSKTWISSAFWKISISGRTSTYKWIKSSHRVGFLQWECVLKVASMPLKEEISQNISNTTGNKSIKTTHRLNTGCRFGPNSKQQSSEYFIESVLPEPLLINKLSLITGILTT